MYEPEPVDFTTATATIVLCDDSLILPLPMHSSVALSYCSRLALISCHYCRGWYYTVTVIAYEIELAYESKLEYKVGYRAKVNEHTM